jgi:tetratricopeptide (TPR) repeat protein
MSAFLRDVMVELAKTDPKVITEKLGELKVLYERLPNLQPPHNSSPTFCLWIRQRAESLSALPLLEQAASHGVNLDPHSWRQLALAYHELGKFDEAIYCSERVNAYGRPSVESTEALAFYHSEAGHVEKAIEIGVQSYLLYAEQIDRPDFSLPRFLGLADGYDFLIQWAQRWEEFRQRCTENLRADQWHGEKVKSLAVVVGFGGTPWISKLLTTSPTSMPDRGQGDYIFLCFWSQFLHSFADDVVIVVPKGHQKQYPDLFKFLSKRARIVETCPPNSEREYDSMFTVLLDQDPEKIFAASKTLPIWKADAPIKIQSSKLKVGICWMAAVFENSYTTRKKRTLNETQVNRLITETQDQVEWVNLQYGTHRDGIINPEIKTWEDTANVIAGLDLVVTVDTAVMHMAAALGVRCLVPITPIADTKFAWDGTRCRFYPSIRLFRSRGFGFDFAVDQIIQELKICPNQNS